jgi:hypothetical protein
MAEKGQILDMTPIGMKFVVMKTSADTQGKLLDLHWELLPGCNMKDHCQESSRCRHQNSWCYSKARWC